VRASAPPAASLTEALLRLLDALRGRERARLVAAPAPRSVPPPPRSRLRRLRASRPTLTLVRAHHAPARERQPRPTPRRLVRAGRIVVDARHRFPLVAEAGGDRSRLTGDAAEG
jgi:hypothetical protein